MDIPAIASRNVPNEAAQDHIYRHRFSFSGPIHLRFRLAEC